MKLRNNIFAAAFDYLKRNTDIKTQKELAKRMGVNENTISRILKDYVEVTEDIITKLQTASGCVFNLQWLRGEDPDHMLAKDLEAEKQQQQEPKRNEGADDMLKLYARMLQNADDLSRQLQIELASVRTLKAELQQTRDELHDVAKNIAQYFDAKVASQPKRTATAGLAEATRRLISSDYIRSIEALAAKKPKRKK